MRIHIAYRAALGLALLAPAAACGGDSAGPAPSTTEIRLVSTVGVPANYGLHDTFVRDGLAFLCVWDEGVFIYDFGNGIAGGTPHALIADDRDAEAATWIQRLVPRLGEGVEGPLGGEAQANGA